MENSWWLMVQVSLCGSPSTISLEFQLLPQLLRKEKDEASLPICFRQDSLMPSFSFCGR
jgi:hypothetical protein